MAKHLCCNVLALGCCVYSRAGCRLCCHTQEAHGAALRLEVVGHKQAVAAARSDTGVKAGNILCCRHTGRGWHVPAGIQSTM